MFYKRVLVYSLNREITVLGTGKYTGPEIDGMSVMINCMAMNKSWHTRQLRFAEEISLPPQNNRPRGVTSIHPFITPSSTPLHPP